MKSFTNVDDKPKRKNTRFAMTNKEVTGSEASADRPMTSLEADKSKGHFDSGAAPRVGGKAKATQGGVPKGGSKKMLVRSKKNVRNNAASKQAKTSARKLY